MLILFAGEKAINHGRIKQTKLINYYYYYNQTYHPNIFTFQIMLEFALCTNIELRYPMRSITYTYIDDNIPLEQHTSHTHRPQNTLI